MKLQKIIPTRVSMKLLFGIFLSTVSVGIAFISFAQHEGAPDVSLFEPGTDPFHKAEPVKGEDVLPMHEVQSIIARGNLHAIQELPVDDVFKLVAESPISIIKLDAQTLAELSPTMHTAIADGFEEYKAKLEKVASGKTMSPEEALLLSQNAAMINFKLGQALELAVARHDLPAARSLSDAFARSLMLLDPNMPRAEGSQVIDRVQLTMNDVLTNVAHSNAITPAEKKEFISAMLDILPRITRDKNTRPAIKESSLAGQLLIISSLPVDLFALLNEAQITQIRDIINQSIESATTGAALIHFIEPALDAMVGAVTPAMQAEFAAQKTLTARFKALTSLLTSGLSLITSLFRKGDLTVYDAVKFIDTNATDLTEAEKATIVTNATTVHELNPSEITQLQSLLKALRAGQRISTQQLPYKVRQAAFELLSGPLIIKLAKLNEQQVSVITPAEVLDARRNTFNAANETVYKALLG